MLANAHTDHSIPLFFTHKFKITYLIITITISPNVIGASAASLFTNHSVQL